jgi:hypothetical protein
VLHFVIWTCITVPPNFRWQQWLERRFPTYYEEDRVDLGKREGDEKVGVVSGFLSRDRQEESGLALH